MACLDEELHVSVDEIYGESSADDSPTMRWFTCRLKLSYPNPKLNFRSFSTPKTSAGG